MARAKTAERTSVGPQMAGRAGAHQRPEPPGRDITTQESARTPLLEALRDERRAAEQDANDTDTDDEALADEMGRVGLPDGGEGGDSNPLRKRSNRGSPDCRARPYFLARGELLPVFGGSAEATRSLRERLK